MSAKEERAERERRLFSFKIRDVSILGSERKILITDEEMWKILNFKGTGERMTFSEVIREVYEFNWYLMELEFETGEVTSAHLKYSDFIIINNILVVFEDGDIRLKKVL